MRPMTSVTTQECSTAGCTNPAAFTTRINPAWCHVCIDDMVRAGGLEPVEPFTRARRGWLTRCMTCAVQAHYKLDYIQAKNASGEKTCRACYWRARADERRQEPWNEFKRAMLDLLREYTPEQILAVDPAPHVREFLESGWWPLERIVAHLDKHGFDFITTTADVNDGDDPVVLRCRACQKISVERLSNVEYGCSCLQNTRASNPVNPRPGRVLLTESQSPALQWWDHERNDEATLRTVTVLAIRACHWVCRSAGFALRKKSTGWSLGRPARSVMPGGGRRNGRSPRRRMSAGRSRRSLTCLSWRRRGWMRPILVT
jgi:hypothetical protein